MLKGGFISSQEFNLKEEKLSHLDISVIVKIINLMGVSSDLTSLNINGISFDGKECKMADDGIIFHDLNGRIILLNTSGEIKTIDGNNVCRFGKISTILNRIHYDEVISRVKKALLLRKQIETDFEKAIFVEILSQNIYSDKREKYISKRLSNDELSAILNKVS